MTRLFSNTLIASTFVMSTALLTACPRDPEPAPGSDTDSTSTGEECSTGNCTSTGADNVDTTGGQDDAPPDSTASNDDTMPDTGTGADACAVSADCAPDVCVAPFNPKLGVFGRGPFECVAECVVLEDELRWCADASACCDAEAECTDRGYCELPGQADSTGGDNTSTGADDTGGDDTSGGSSGSGTTG